MHVFVTGGAGFLGSHLVDACLARGDRVTVLDDFSTGRRENLRDYPQLTVEHGSVCDGARVAAIAGGADLIVHLAAAVGVRRVREAPSAAMQTNVLGVQAVLDAAVSADLPVVLASSSEVYGTGVPVPFREDAPLSIGQTHEWRSGYACAKALGECAALARAHDDGLRVVIARLFNTVGPRQRSRYGMVLPTFVARALRNERLTVFGDGNQTRCFAHVEDVVSALLELAERECFGRVFNVGSDVEWRIVDVARRVIELTGSSSVIEFEPFERAHPGFGGDVVRRVPDLGRLCSALGRTPRGDLDAILVDVIESVRLNNGSLAVPG